MRVSWVLVSLFLLATAAAQRAKKRGSRDGKKIEGQTTVVSCRVFQKDVCDKSRKNIIKINKSITNSHNCQMYCYSTEGCAHFTHYEKTRKHRRECILFRDCNKNVKKCKDCISGPIMPRIRECLAAKQEVAPPTEGTRKPCTFGCSGVCVGPRCPELLSGLPKDTLNAKAVEAPVAVPMDASGAPTVAMEAQGGTIDTDPAVPESNEQGNSDDYGTEYDDATVQVDEDIFEEPGSVEDYSNDYDNDYEYNDYDDSPGNDYDSSYNEEDTSVYFNEEVEEEDTEMIDDGPLEEEAVTEDEEEIPDEDINIDAGFLNDNKGNTVELPKVSPRASTTTSTGPTFIFYFCAMGGNNQNGALSAVDVLGNGITNALQALSIAPMPSTVTKGQGCSAAYTGEAITSCSNGYSVLSPYGYLYKPGSCYDYNLYNNDWKQTGAKLTTFRMGGTMTKLGRYLMASGGYRGKRSLKSIELFDPKRPEKGWKRMGRMTMPTSVSEHCTVTIKGRNGKEVMIIGGKGREDRAIKLDVKSNKWYSLNRLNAGRRKHACVKATINGRTGVVVSGGINGKDRNMTSVEFYDTASGAWYTLPSLRKGRQSHAMVINKGKIMVAGGVGAGRKGQQYLDDIEMFTGQRWVKSKMKLNQPRASFSLVRIPRTGRSAANTNQAKPLRKSAGTRKQTNQTRRRANTKKRNKQTQRSPRSN